MKIFNLRVTGWDGDCFNSILIHENKTQEQFEEDVKSLLIEHGAAYINSDDNDYRCNSGWCEFILPFLLAIGYVEAEINSVVLTETGIIKSDSANTLDYGKWREVVGEELYNLAIARNKEIENDLQ